MVGGLCFRRNRRVYWMGRGSLGGEAMPGYILVPMMKLIEIVAVGTDCCMLEHSHYLTASPATAAQLVVDDPVADSSSAPDLYPSIYS